MTMQTIDLLQLTIALVSIKSFSQGIRGIQRIDMGYVHCLTGEKEISRETLIQRRMLIKQVKFCSLLEFQRYFNKLCKICQTNSEHRFLNILFLLLLT